MASARQTGRIARRAYPASVQASGRVVRGTPVFPVVLLLAIPASRTTIAGIVLIGLMRR